MKYQKKKYARPLKPWNKERIEFEKKLLEQYGLRRKHEIWRTESIVRNFRRLARELAAKHDKEKESVLLEKINKLGLGVKTLDDVLALTLENILERRLQTIVFKKGLAASPKQARQFIVHGHVVINGRKVKWPSMLVPIGLEDTVRIVLKKGIEQEKSVTGDINVAET